MTLTVYHASGTVLCTCPRYLAFIVLSARLWNEFQSIDVHGGRERRGSCRAGLVSQLLLCLWNLGCCSQYLREREHEDYGLLVKTRRNNFTLIPRK